MAPHYPNELLPTVDLTLEEFNTKARLINTDTDAKELPLTLAQYTLAGRITMDDEEGEEGEVRLNVTAPEYYHADQGAIKVTRFFRGLIGVADTMSFKCSMNIRPVPLARDRMRNLMGKTTTVSNSVRSLHSYYKKLTKELNTEWSLYRRSVARRATCAVCYQ